MMLFSFPYWLEATLVIILFVGGFLFIIWKDNGNLKIIPEAFGDFFRRLYLMFYKNIENEEAYKENEALRKADEEYKKQLKKKKKS